MRIAYLANVRFPSERAHATQIAHMCHAFSQTGSQVTLFAKRAPELSEDSVNNFFSVDSGFKVTGLRSLRLIPSIRPSFYLSEFLFASNFLLFYSKRKYDLVYARSEWIVLVLSFFISNEKLAWESHEASYNFAARHILKKKIKTVVISEGIYDEYLDRGILPKIMLVAHDGVDDSFFGKVASQQEARSSLGLKQRVKVAMYIGGLDQWKGVDTFFAAAELLPNILFVAIGGTKEAVASYSKQYPLVTYLGQRPYSELPSNQQAADVLIIPNTAKNDLSAKYTSPLKLFAHMSSGVPMVCSDIPSLKVVLGDTGATFVEPDDVRSLGQGITNVFKDFKSSKEAAVRVKSSSKKWTWNNRAKEILSFVSG